MFSSLLLLPLLASSVLAGVAPSYLNYTTVKGYFLQDVASTNASTFNYTAVNFGLINQTYTGQPATTALTQWQQFALEVKRLNKGAEKGTSYKVLFLGRHGEGYHNAAETFYGTPAWNCYWSLLNGNSTNSWEDAKITLNGIAQALVANKFWKHLIEVQKITTPDAYFTSPLARCLETANLTFSGLDLPKRKPFVPTVKEYLREGISIHTCDHRSNKTWIASTYPSYKIEAGFTEFDETWNGITAESTPAEAVRSKFVLDSIIGAQGCDKDTYLSFTSHSGEIASILSVLGHQSFSLSTGAVIPVLVKVQLITGTPSPTVALYTPSAHCTVPPLSSIPNGACVCPSSAAPVTTRLVTESPVVSPITTFTPVAGL